MPQLDTGDLSTLSLEELEALHKNVTKALASFHARREKEFAEKVKADAKSMGISPDTLSSMFQSAKKTEKAPLPPKFRHREDHCLTWSGRGKKPRWVEEFGEEIAPQ